MQIALKDEEASALVELLYSALLELGTKINSAQNAGIREALKHREGVLRQLMDHLMRFRVPRAA